MNSEEEQKRRLRLRAKPRSEQDLRAIARVIIQLALADAQSSPAKLDDQEKSA